MKNCFDKLIVREPRERRCWHFVHPLNFLLFPVMIPDHKSPIADLQHGNRMSKPEKLPAPPLPSLEECVEYIEQKCEEAGITPSVFVERHGWVRSSFWRVKKGQMQPKYSGMVVLVNEAAKLDPEVEAAAA